MEKTMKRFGVLLVAALVLVCFIKLPVKASEGDVGAAGSVDTTDNNAEMKDPEEPDGEDTAGSGELAGGDATGTTKPEAEEYTYTVRFFTGMQGTFKDGTDMRAEYEVKNGTWLRFDPNEVELNNGSKYYIKGIRESGKDNNTSMSEPYFQVNRDIDYVVAYGLRGNMVEYDVYYIDRNGNELAPHDVYYGKVGDKPVVAYLYIDGYLPQTYNLTQTLSADPSENVFRFIYTPIAGGAQAGGGTFTTVTLPGTTTQTVTEVIDDGGGAVAAAGGGAGAAAAGADGVTINEPAVPLDTIDLDNQTEDGVYIEEPTVPLSDMNLQLGPIEVDAQRLLVTLVILTATAVIGVASYWYWRPYRKEKKNEKNAARSM